MKKKIPLFVLIAAVLTVGIYYSVWNSMVHVPTLEQGFGIWESEVIIDDASPGATGQVPLTIICGEDYARDFAVSIQQANPNKLKDGYQLFPLECYGWVTLPEEPIHIEAGGHHRLDIPFRVPYSTTVPEGTKMEARLRVTELGQGGLVQLAIEAKWFIIITAMDESS